MSDHEKPPLHPIVQEQISLQLHSIDEKYWAILRGMRVKRFIPASEPVPPQTPERLLRYLISYAMELFKIEADSYHELVNAGSYPAWIGALEERMLRRVLGTVEKIESADPNFTIGFHGLDHHRMENELRGTLWQVANTYRWNASRSDASADAVLAMRDAGVWWTETLPLGEQQEPNPKPPQRDARVRLRSTVESPSAARKMEAYLAAKGIGLTDFASSAGTTDRTLRSFRKTGRVSRSILAGIAKAMGITKEELLK